MSKKQTLRLTCPQWQGGVNPNYVFGAELLSFIAPPSTTDKNITICVDKNFDTNCQTEDGVDFGESLYEQMAKVKQILMENNPERLIVFGGDCSVTQVPFVVVKHFCNA